MNKKRLPVGITIAVFSVCAIGIAILAVWPFTESIPQERHRTRLIVPIAAGSPETDSATAERMGFEDTYRLRAFLADGEQAISVLNHDFDNDSIEEQIVVYRNVYDSDSPVFIAFFAYDGRGYRRLWDAPTAATIPGTVSLYMLDLLGDRSTSVVVTGMNAQGEHTMTIFHHSPFHDRNIPFTQIAAIQVDGSIAIQEAERTIAYRQGIARGQPYTITAWGRDIESDNLLDRIEITYEYNPARGFFERNRISRVPGTHIEQRRLREILSGEPKVFEDFINDLWYHVNPDGTIDRRQYIYFDPARREIIFYGYEIQQVYNWQQSISTRYGLYIASQNMSIATLRRILDIELESLDSIRLRVIRQVRMRIDVGESWDGTYRRAASLPRSSPSAEQTVRPYAEAVYDSSMGRLQFHANGEYELSSGGALTLGRYAFFQVADSRLLELRPNGNTNANNDSRLVFLVSAAASPNSAELNTIHDLDNLSLTRVRLGATGIHELHESPILLTRAP